MYACVIVSKKKSAVNVTNKTIQVCVCAYLFDSRYIVLSHKTSTTEQQPFVRLENNEPENQTRQVVLCIKGVVDVDRSIDV